MFTNYKVCTLLNAKVIKVSFKKTGRPKNMPKGLPGFVSSHSGEIAPLMPISSSAESKLLPPERLELTVNSKEETNGIEGQYGLLWLKLSVKAIESNWAKRSQLEPGSSWAWPILTRSQTGPRSQYGLEHTHHCFSRESFLT